MTKQRSIYIPNQHQTTENKNEKFEIGIYLIGSLRNQEIPKLARRLREELGVEVFDDWFSPGPKADDYWRDFEHARGSSYKQALKSYAGTHVFEFDKYHIDRLPIVVMAMPAGKSGHLELGYSLGKGKRGYIFFEEEPERWDVMYQFATDIFFNEKELVAELKKAIAELKKEHTNWVINPRTPERKEESTEMTGRLVEEKNK